MFKRSLFIYIDICIYIHIYIYIYIIVCIYIYSFFLFFWSGHRGSKAYSLRDGVVRKPEHRIWLPLDSVPIFKILCFPSEMILVPSFSPPSEIRPGALLYITSCPSPLSFRPFCLLSVHNAYSAAPLQCLVPPIVRPPESYQPSGSGRPMSSSSFPNQRPICRFAPPPPTCAAGGTWIGCGCGGEGDGAPRDGCESVDSSAGITSWRTGACLRPTLDFPLEFLRFPPGPKSVVSSGRQAPVATQVLPAWRDDRLRTRREPQELKREIERRA